MLLADCVIEPVHDALLGLAANIARTVISSLQWNRTNLVSQLEAVQCLLRVIAFMAMAGKLGDTFDARVCKKRTSWKTQCKVT